MDLRERPYEGVRRHPWEVARFQFFLRVLRDGNTLSADRVLDVGSGDAWFARCLLEHLPPAVRVTCWDTGYTQELASSLQDAHDPRIELVSARPASPYSLITALDVLEHVDDDASFLRSIVDEALAPGAHLLISVPAWPSLFTSRDTALLHFRRYRPSDAAALLRSCGLRLLRSGGMFSSLLAPRTVRRAAEWVLRPAPPAQAPALQWSHGPALTRLVGGMLALDNAASLWASAHERSLPGLSWWALCRKS